MRKYATSLLGEIIRNFVSFYELLLMFRTR